MSLLVSVLAAVVTFLIQGGSRHAPPAPSVPASAPAALPAVVESDDRFVLDAAGFRDYRFPPNSTFCNPRFLEGAAAARAIAGESADRFASSPVEDTCGTLRAEN
jgi:hypothetical protein